MCDICDPLSKSIEIIKSEMPRRRLSSGFSIQAVELVSLGNPAPGVTQELGFGVNLLYRRVNPASPSAQRQCPFL